MNTVGSENVARAAASVGARLVHLSTDVVFDGRKGAPYVEEDPLSPLTAVRPREGRGGDPRGARPPRTRCSSGRRSSYGGRTPSKHELAADDPGFTFYTNEIRSPVQVTDLAPALLELAELDTAGPLHVAGADDVSRAEFAELIRGGPVPSRPAPETRPLDCSLDSSARPGAAAHAPPRRARGARPGGVGEVAAEPLSRAARPDAASSVVPIASAIGTPCVLASGRAAHPSGERHSANPS